MFLVVGLNSDCLSWAGPGKVSFASQTRAAEGPGWFLCDLIITQQVLPESLVGKSGFLFH
jgi:hypothetical protein